MDIKLYDYDFNLLCVENKFSSLNSEIYYNDVGKLEIHLPLSSPVLPAVMDNPFILVKYGKRTAVMTGVMAQNELIVYGRSCNWFLGKRTVPPFSQENCPEGISLGENLEETVRSIALLSFSDVDNFVLGDKCGITDNTAFWRNARNNALEVVRDAMDLCKGGFKLDFDVSNKRWVFACLMGKTLEYVISEAHRNAHDIEFNRDILDYYTCAYYDKEVVEVEVDEEGNETELTRDVETFIEKKPASGMYRFEGQLSAKGESEAASELQKLDVNEIIRAKFRELTFEKDYNLGDVVRLRIDKGNYRTTVKRRIIGVKENYDESGYSEQPILSEDKEVITE